VVKRLVIALVLVLAASSTAGAQNIPGTRDWVWMKQRQGNVRDQYSVSCTVNTQLLTAAQTRNATSVTCTNMSASGGNSAGICARAAAAGACDAVSKFSFPLAPQNGVTLDNSAPGDWSCDGVGGTAVVNCHVERFFATDAAGNIIRPANDPTPTPIPTQTPGPTPT